MKYQKKLNEIEVLQKKLNEIEAFQMTPDRIETLDHADWPTWLLDAHCKRETDVGALVYEGMFDDPESTVKITTLGGPLFVDRNDWIILNAKGQLYPCDPITFEAIYEPVKSV